MAAGSFKIKNISVGNVVLSDLGATLTAGEIRNVHNYGFHDVARSYQTGDLGTAITNDEIIAVQSDGVTEFSKADTDVLFSNLFDVNLGRTNVFTGAVYVQPEPKLGGFESIKNAVDSITDASDTKRYTIFVAPGVYQEDTITMKPFVSITSLAGIKDTIIEPDGPNKDLILATANCQLNGVILRDVTGSGFAAIKATNTAGGRFTINDSEILNCSNYLIADSTAASVNVDIDRCTFNITNVTERAIQQIGAGGNLCLVLLTDFGIVVQDDASLIEATVVTGPTAIYITDSFNYSGKSALAGGPTSVPGLVMENGANVTVGNGFITDFDINCQVRNVGAAPNLDLLTGNFQGSGTRDLSIEHPGTTGSIFTKAQRSKVFIDPASPISVFYLDPVDRGIVSIGPIYIGSEHNSITDVNDLINAEPTMGVMDGGALTDAGGLDVDIAEGFGYLMVTPFPTHETRRVEWGATTLTLGANTTRWIFVNNASVVVTSVSRPNERHNVILGRVNTNATGIEFLENTPVVAHHAGNLLNIAIRDALGPVYSAGSLVMENAVTPRELDVGSGLYFVGQTRITPSGGTSITFTEYFHTAGVFTPNSGVTVVDNTQYDDGTNLVALSAGFFAKHSLYVVSEGVNEKYFLLYSQAEYPDLLTAEGASIPAPPSSFDGGAVVLIANIIVQQGVANIDTIQDSRPVIGFRASGVSASANHGNLFGLAGDDHPQYLLVDGTRSMNSNLNMGTNNIINVTEVDGVDVSDHFTRHLPNGADPITTAAPTANLTADTTNTIGVQNSLARSDHGHAIDTAIAVTIGSTSANAEGVATTLARSDHTHEITGLQETITWQDEGVAIGTGVFTTVNFIGEQVTATDVGSGVLNVTVSPFGDSFQEESSDALSTTTSTTFQNKLTLTTPSLPAGNYRIGFYAEMSNPAGNNVRPETQLIQNGTTVLAIYSFDFVQLDDIIPTSGFGHVALSGTHTFNLEFRVSPVGGAGTAGIRRARLEIYRTS